MMEMTRIEKKESGERLAFSPNLLLNVQALFLKGWRFEICEERLVAKKYPTEEIKMFASDLEFKTWVDKEISPLPKCTAPTQNVFDALRELTTKKRQFMGNHLYLQDVLKEHPQDAPFWRPLHVNINRWIAHYFQFVRECQNQKPWQWRTFTTDLENRGWHFCSLNYTETIYLKREMSDEQEYFHVQIDSSAEEIAPLVFETEQEAIQYINNRCDLILFAYEEHIQQEKKAFANIPFQQSEEFIHFLLDTGLVFVEKVSMNNTHKGQLAVKIFYLQRYLGFVDGDTSELPIRQNCYSFLNDVQKQDVFNIVFSFLED